MSERTWESWAPAWARRADGSPLIEGRYEAREEGEPQRVEVRCLECGEEFQTTCTSGNPRPHVAKFAVVHRQEHVLRQSKK